MTWLTEIHAQVDALTMSHLDRFRFDQIFININNDDDDNNDIFLKGIIYNYYY